MRYGVILPGINTIRLCACDIMGFDPKLKH